MASEVLIKMPAVSFNKQVKEMDDITILSLPSSSDSALQRVNQLEHNIRFLREQHHLMLTSLHKEVEVLRHRNRELQFQLVMTNGSMPILYSQDSSPEDDSRPKIVLTPKQPNVNPLQVELLEKDLAELRIDLKEERDKNQQLSEVVITQQRQIDQMKFVNENGSNETKDAACQTNSPEMGRKLDEAHRSIKSLRRENDDLRKELNKFKENMQQENASRNNYRFPPLQNAPFRHHRSGMGGYRNNKDGMGSRSGTTSLPALQQQNNGMYMYGGPPRRSQQHRSSYFYNGRYSNNHNNGNNYNNSNNKYRASTEQRY